MIFMRNKGKVMEARGNWCLYLRNFMFLSSDTTFNGLCVDMRKQSTEKERQRERARQVVKDVGAYMPKGK